MQVIVMAAGRGSRMRPLTDNVHKSMLTFRKSESFLSKLFNSLNEYEPDNVVIVTGYRSQDIRKFASGYQFRHEVIYNERFDEDVNMYSMNLALELVDESSPVIIVEADIYIDDIAFRDIYSESRTDHSIWFTRGPCSSSRMGGILLADSDDKIQDIRIARSYERKYQDYLKLLGVMTISTKHLPIYRSLVQKYVEEGINDYYLVPWLENLGRLDCRKHDLAQHRVESVNSVDEFDAFVKMINAPREKKVIDLVDVGTLKPIEGHYDSRRDLLIEKISSDRKWTRPIIIEQNHNLILDGHHRWEVAKYLNLKRIPCVGINYDDVFIWSLKESEYVDKDTVISRALAGEVYPHKTVKHNFEFDVPQCDFRLEDLAI